MPQIQVHGKFLLIGLAVLVLLVMLNYNLTLNPSSTPKSSQEAPQVNYNNNNKKDDYQKPPPPKPTPVSPPKEEEPEDEPEEDEPPVSEVATVENVYEQCSGKGVFLDNRYGCCCDTEFTGGTCQNLVNRGNGEDETRKDTFSKIYQYGSWGSSESKSGPGSTHSITKSIRAWLPKMIKKYNITSFLDLPCGDFNWMRLTEFPDKDFSYYGGDIVPSLIVNLRKQYYKWSKVGTDGFSADDEQIKFNAKFVVLDGVNQQLCRPFDVVFSRDVLVHLPYSAIKKFIQNLNNSGSKYFITTTFPKHSNENYDIRVGEWRGLNLRLPPFNFPEPLELLNEVEQRAPYNDKSVGLWELPLPTNFG